MKMRTHFNIARLSIEDNLQAYDVTDKSTLYKWAFYIGTIMPDLTITQFIHPHFYAKSADYVFQKLCRIESKPVKSVLDAIILGEMVHYLSDYCCFVHKSGRIGNPSVHLRYEKEIKNYVLSNYPDLQQKISHNKLRIVGSEEIIELIRNKISDYSKMVSSFDLDILKSVELSSLVYHGILLS